MSKLDMRRRGRPAAFASSIGLSLGLMLALGALSACKKKQPPPAEPAAAEEAAQAEDVQEGVTDEAETAAAAPESADAAAAAADEPAGDRTAALLEPSKLTEKAPETFKARFTTTEGDFEVEIYRDWAPNGADRFYNLVKSGFFDDTGFFRVVPGFIIQWGLSGNPAVNTAWREATIEDDPVKESNKPGTLVFAKTNAPNSRTTQLFINFKHNSFLDEMGFAPFGKVTEGMKVVEALNSEYREQPQQPLIQMRGNDYLKQTFPRLDFIKKAEIVE